MRRNILIIISFLTLLVSSGCTNLDEKWYSEVTPDTYFTSKETVYSFLVRSFTHWRWFHGFDRAILQECTTDEMCVTQKGIHYNDVRYSQLQHHDWTPLHPMPHPISVQTPLLVLLLLLLPSPELQDTGLPQVVHRQPASTLIILS